jgi:uncharacterized protein (TIGR02246 family)
MNCTDRCMIPIARLSGLACFLLILPITVSQGYCQDAPASARAAPKTVARSAPDAESAAIRAQSEAFIEAFNKKDAKAVVEFWTPDGEYIDDEGIRHAGREAIEKGYTQFFKANPDAKLKLSIDSIRVLSPSAAIEDGQAMVEPPIPGAAGASKYTAFYVKVDGKWRMASLRDFYEGSSITNSNLADLEWLIGDWLAEEHGVKSESTCRWIANNSYVERRYTTRHLDGTTASGLQVIGWDASIGSIRSWNFSPDGGNAIGTWSPIEGGWHAQVQGTTADGIPTSAVNILKRLDDNAYSWQSTERQVGDQPLPDTDEVVIKRQRKAVAKK